MNEDINFIVKWFTDSGEGGIWAYTKEYKNAFNSIKDLIDSHIIDARIRSVPPITCIKIEKVKNLDSFMIENKEEPTMKDYYYTVKYIDEAGDENTWAYMKEYKDAMRSIKALVDNVEGVVITYINIEKIETADGFVCGYQDLKNAAATGTKFGNFPEDDITRGYNNIFIGKKKDDAR